MSTFIVIESKVFDFTSFLNLGKVFFELVGRAELHTNVWFLAQLLRIFAKNVAHVSGLNKHLNCSLLTVYHHVVGVTLVHILLKFGVCSFLLGTSSHHVASSCEEE